MNNLIRSVAIVDDHILYRQTVSRYLHTLGFNVAMEAANGMEFIRLLETCSSFPEACLLDVEMPLMDGVATTRVLRARYPAIKIVALTLSQDSNKTKNILEAGVSGILFKGMDAPQLGNALYKVLIS